MTAAIGLTRAEVDYLAGLLERVPEVESWAALALSGMSAQRSSGARRPQPGSRPPYPVHVADLVDELKGELVSTIRLVCEQRDGLEYSGGDSLSGCARWLIRYRFALQVMVGAVESFDSLCMVIEKGLRILVEREDVVVDGERVREAHGQLVTAWYVEKLAGKLGEQGKGLNRHRVRRLVEWGVLHPIEGDSDEALFRLGDVLEAHEVTPRRQRNA